MTIITALKTVAFIFVFFVLVHWLTAGQDEIIQGPPDPPLFSSQK